MEQLRQVSNLLAERLEFPDAVINTVSNYASMVFTPLLEPFSEVLHAALPTQMASLEAFVKSQQHPLSKHLPLLTPTPAIFALVMYFVTLFVLFVVGKATGPMKVRTLSLFHNAFLTFLSLYMCVAILVTAFANGCYGWNNAVMPSSDPNSYRLAKLLWLFYVSKVPEFVDTFIMMFKQNYRQVSFLHLYHHVSVFTIWFITIMMAPGGDGYFSAMLNSGIHVVMYGYYWLTAVFPDGKIRRFLNSFKFVITKGQMTQFFLNFCQAAYCLYIADRVLYSKPLLQLLLGYMVTLLALFANFLIKNQSAPKAAKPAAAAPAAPTKSASPVAARTSASPPKAAPSTSAKKTPVKK